jgi:prolipoprotein diacylglyceryltransferase
MVPILFEVNGIPVYSHGFFFLMALVAGTALLVLESRRRRWPKEEVIPITLAAFVGGMIGARLSILFFNGWETAPIVLNFYALFDPRIGPGSIIGGVIGAYVGGYIASKAIGKDGCACDAFAPARRSPPRSDAWAIFSPRKMDSASRPRSPGEFTSPAQVISSIPRRYTICCSI